MPDRQRVLLLEIKHTFEVQMKVNVVCGDILKVPAHALITTITCNGVWMGEINDDLRDVSLHFHDQALQMLPLIDGMPLRLTGNGTLLFQDLILVVDDLRQPLDSIVFYGLEAAQASGFSKVTLPAIRMEVISALNSDVPEVVAEMVNGVQRFASKGNDLDLTFVVRDQETEALLNEALTP